MKLEKKTAFIRTQKKKKKKKARFVYNGLSPGPYIISYKGQMGPSWADNPN